LPTLKPNHCNKCSMVKPVFSDQLPMCAGSAET
jgi:hypothetical protein